MSLPGAFSQGAPTPSVGGQVGLSACLLILCQLPPLPRSPALRSQVGNPRPRAGKALGLGPKPPRAPTKLPAPQVSAPGSLGAREVKSGKLL